MPSTPCRQPRCPNLVNSRAMKGFCNDHVDQRSNWSRRPSRKGSTTSRGYGHAWRKLREEILRRDDYLCVSCSKSGRHVPATDVDHIINKASGGGDEASNLQSLCRKCHKQKTQIEATGLSFFMPRWMPEIPSATLVFGPPGSGKSRWAKENALEGVEIVDLDYIIAENSGKPFYVMTEKDRQAGIAIRNKILLRCASNRIPCIIVLTGNKKAHREWWISKICPKDVVVMQASAAECAKRILNDERRPREAMHSMIDAAYDWERD